MANDGEAYSGALGAFPYAFRKSESRVFRAYVVFGGLLALLLAVLFGVGLVVFVARTAGGSGTATFSRAFLVTVGLFLVAPLVAPVLLVARRHRRVGNEPRYDALIAATGFLFAGSLYVAAVVSTPATQQQPVTGVLEPVATALYGLPRLASLPILAVSAALVGLVHWRFR